MPSSLRLAGFVALAVGLIAGASACEYQGPAGAPRVGVAGDSIVRETEAALRNRLQTDHRVAVHAFNNAHFDQLRVPVQQMVSSGSQSVVVAAGSPDVVAATDPTYGFVPVIWIRDLVAAAGDVPCLALVTVKVNGVAPIATAHWAQGARTINNELRRQDAAHDNVVVANWSKKADEHPEWFLGDGLHLNAAGRAGYARFLDAAADC